MVVGPSTDTSQRSRSGIPSDIRRSSIQQRLWAQIKNVLWCSVYSILSLLHPCSLQVPVFLPSSSQVRREWFSTYRANKAQEFHRHFGNWGICAGQLGRIRNHQYILHQYKGILVALEVQLR